MLNVTGSASVVVVSNPSANVETFLACANFAAMRDALALDTKAALTAQLTTITPADAAGTPDYAIAAVTNTSPFGFSNAAEAITLLYVVKNLQTRFAELESRLQALDLIG